MEEKKVPKHIAIVLDGNRRWAREHALPTLEGHRRGYKMAIELSRRARKIGVEYMTLWGFSTENWNRTKDEVGYLMKMYETWIDEYLKEALANEVRLVHIGRKDRLNTVLMNKIIDAQEKTKHFTKNTLIIALDYGGRDEILRAIEKIRNSKEEIPNVDKDTFRKFLDMADIPDPDLIIRTGGEQRLSGFLLWECQYAELIFVDKKLPEFTPDDLEACIEEYYDRQRRFGK